MKIVVVVEIYNFLLQIFFIWSQLEEVIDILWRSKIWILNLNIISIIWASNWNQRDGLNYKVVDLIEIHNFGVEFTSMCMNMKILYFLKICCWEKKEIPLNLRFEYIFDYLSIKMILNDKSMNYKVVTLEESYKFRITFIYILGSCERNIFFFEKYASREETFVSIYWAWTWLQMKKFWTRKL
jgi:hypothetical protein